LREGKKEEDFQLILRVKLEGRPVRRQHEDPLLPIFRQLDQSQGKSPAEEHAG